MIYYKPKFAFTLIFLIHSLGEAFCRFKFKTFYDVMVTGTVIRSKLHLVTVLFCVPIVLSFCSELDVNKF